MPWDDILGELKKMKQQEYQKIKEEYPNNLVTNSDPPEQADQQAAIPQRQWYQFGDWFTRTDELLEAILLQLQGMGALIAPPAPTPVEPTPIPTEFVAILQNQLGLLGLIRNYLEGFNFITGQGIVQTAGTPIELISTVKTYLVMIRADIANTGNIYIGGTGVSAATGYFLGAGEAMTIQIDNLKKSIWIDADVSGEGVSWLALID